MQDLRKLSPLEAQFFGIRWLAEYLARASARSVLRKEYTRTSGAVIEEYEGIRRNYLERFRAAPMPLEAYLVSEADDAIDDRYLQVLDRNLYSGALAEATRRLQQSLIQAIDFYRPKSVLEFGCGAGRNLLAIKRARPGVRCIGLELTPASVEVAKLASQRYNLETEVHVADVTKPVTQAESADVCFSVHALEQIPDSRLVFEQMYRLARKAVVLFEPIVELYGWSPRYMAARIRAHHLDRLRGLYPYILRKRHKIGLARLPDATSNALNPTVELHVLTESSV
jgi:SAM-dependent methyltransferase